MSSRMWTIVVIGKQLIKLGLLISHFRILYIQSSLPMVRRLICDENASPYPLMLSYFVQTKCHDIFFQIGEKLLNGE
jgi:hypothetical protein